MLEIRIDNAHSQVITDSPELKRHLSDALSYETPGSTFAKAATPWWDGRVRLMNKAGVFPTGLIPHLIVYLRRERIEYKFSDARTKPRPSCVYKLTLPFPARNYQTEARNTERSRGVMVMGTGCLAGDTTVLLNRGGNARRYQLADAFKRWQSSWSKDAPMSTRSFTGEKIMRNGVKDIVQSGVKPVWKVELENGLSVKATACHPFLTKAGFKPLRDLTVSDYIMCDLNPKKPNKAKVKPRKANYLQICLQQHPYAGSATKEMAWTLRDGTRKSRRVRMYRVALHRAIVEANMNGLELEDFVLRCRQGDIEGLKFLDPKVYAVHHLDHDTKNNTLQNLEVLRHDDHQKEHGDHDRFGLGGASFARVRSISYVGEEMTYDIACEGPWHNFVANGMVVHNSGKSATSAMLVDRYKVPTLVIAPDTGLREQLYADYAAWFGERHVGKELTDKKPIIVANIQSLAKKPPALFSRFHMLIIDEFHHSGSKTYQYVNQMCSNAYYRYGFTGTFMRSDGTDMEMFGVLSQVIFKKSTSDLIEEGFLVRPYITIVQHNVPKMRVDYKKAYDYIVNDYSFNRLVASIAQEKAFSFNKQTLILVRRKEHGRVLQEMLPSAIYLNGDDPMVRREAVKKAFIKREVRCLIATSIFGEGIDIPSIDVLINARCQKTEIQTSQGIGRALRKAEGKDKAEVYDFMIVGQKHLEDHSVERLNSYRKEPAFKIRKVQASDLF